MGLFDNSYEKLEDALVGKMLHAPGGAFMIARLEGYSRGENDKGVYQPIVSMRPGQAYFPRQRNAILPLIACRDGAGYGGCVILRELRTANGDAITGPSAVSTAIGVLTPKVVGEVVERSDGELELRLPRGATTGHAPSGSQTPKATTPKGIGQKTLERLMPKLSEQWIATGNGQRFEDWLNALLAAHPTEEALRRAIR